jgi:hypothetical protein
MSRGRIYYFVYSAYTGRRFFSLLNLRKEQGNPNKGDPSEIGYSMVYSTVQAFTTLSGPFRSGCVWEPGTQYNNMVLRIPPTYYIVYCMYYYYYYFLFKCKYVIPTMLVTRRVNTLCGGFQGQQENIKIIYIKIILYLNYPLVLNKNLFTEIQFRKYLCTHKTFLITAIIY